MTRFWREGHWRSGPYGDTHWVSGHWVDRDGWSSSWPHFASQVSEGSSSSHQSGTWIEPNARCPVCGAAVFFYRNDFGSRVYFDALGPPWPKHPCMDSSTDADTASSNASLSVLAALVHNKSSLSEPVAPTDVRVPGAFIVVEVEESGRKRLLSLREVGGEQIQIVVSPPPPPIGSIAISLSYELHWFDPRSGNRGTNTVWQRSD